MKLLTNEFNPPKHLRHLMSTHNNYIISIMPVRLLVIFLSMIFLNITYSQTFPILGSEIAINVLYLPQGYVLSNLSGYGYSKTMGDVSNIGNMNPASLSSFNSLNCGFSYQYDSKIRNAWVEDIGYYKNKNGLPQSAGFIYPVKDFRLGVAFSQRYNGSVETDPILIRTVEHPEGTGEYAATTIDYNFISYSLLGSWTLPNAFAQNDKLSFGIRYDLNRFSTYEKIWNEVWKGSFYGSSFALGITYDQTSDNVLKYRLSLFFEKGASINGSPQLQGTDLRTLAHDTTGTGESTNNQTEPEYSESGNIPDKLNLGADITISPVVCISSNFTYVYWNKIGSAQNQPEISLTAVYKTSDALSLSLGTIFTMYNPSYNSSLYVGNKLNALYLTAGTVIHYRLIDLSIALADSHLTSDEWRRQTVGMISLNFHL